MASAAAQRWGPTVSAAQRILGEEGPECVSARERAAVALLAAARGRLVLDMGNFVDTRSEKGFESCRAFLQALESAAHALRLEPAGRSYRQSFTGNYQSLFTGKARNYRVDMLEAGMSLSHSPVIWANGEEYVISGDAVRYSEALRNAWADLCGTLELWVPLAGAEKRPFRLDRSGLCEVLTRLDAAWASFEHAYIAELIKIQEKARSLVKRAIECEGLLSALEQHHYEEELAQLAAYQTEKHELVACLARLNSVANFQRKGRDDLGVGILDSAVDLLRLCAHSRGNLLGAAQTIAVNVVESFEELRDYLHEVQHHLDRLHPQLCQNPGLVARLVRWEETWEIAARYVQSTPVLHAVCHLVPEIRRAQKVCPALAAMVEDTDAELFMVLPRIFWLCFLAEPERPMELLRRLLPHRFQPGPALPGREAASAAIPGQRRLRRRHSAPALSRVADMACDVAAPCMDVELERLAQKFWKAELMVKRALAGTEASVPSSGSPGARLPGPGVWDLLLTRAVGGMGAGSGDAFAPIPVGVPRLRAVSAVEDLMHALERWSMELQRHSPEEWNECIGVLLQCLPPSPQQQGETPTFAV